MFRAWSLLLGLAGLFWAARFARWIRTGLPVPFTVGDAMALVGLPPSPPPPTPWGDVLAAVLASDCGLFCLVLAVAALVIDAVAPHRRG